MKKLLLTTVAALAFAAPAHATEWWQITYPPNNDSHSDAGARCDVADRDPASTLQSHKAIGDVAYTEKPSDAEVDVVYAANENSEAFIMRYFRDPQSCREAAAPASVREARKAERRAAREAVMIAALEESHKIVRLECEQPLYETAPSRMTLAEVNADAPNWHNFYDIDLTAKTTLLSQSHGGEPRALVDVKLLRDSSGELVLPTEANNHGLLPDPKPAKLTFDGDKLTQVDWNEVEDGKVTWSSQLKLTPQGWINTSTGTEPDQGKMSPARCKLAAASLANVPAPAPAGQYKYTECRDYDTKTMTCIP
jgi:hypothetical protein